MGLLFNKALNITSNTDILDDTAPQLLIQKEAPNYPASNCSCRSLLPILLLQPLQGEKLTVLNLPPIANPQILIQQSNGLQQLLDAVAGLLRGRCAHPFIKLLELASNLY